MQLGGLLLAYGIVHTKYFGGLLVGFGKAVYAYQHTLISFYFGLIPVSRSGNFLLNIILLNGFYRAAHGVNLIYINLCGYFNFICQCFYKIGTGQWVNCV